MKSKQTLLVTPPSYRHDLEREVDLIEEIVRLVGYERVPSTVPAGWLEGGSRPAVNVAERELRRFMAGLGFHEMVSLSFSSGRNNRLFPGVGVPAAEPVRILNPVVAEESEMRLSLCPGLLQAVRNNLSVGESGITGFTVGKVFWMAQRPVEAHRLAGVLYGPQPVIGLMQRSSPAPDFLDAKGVLESLLEKFGLLHRIHWQRAGQSAFHPGKSALASVDDVPIAIVGALHPEVEAEFGLARECWLFELDLERSLGYGSARPIFQDLPRFPAVVRDVAVFASVGFASDQVVRFIRQWDSKMVERVVLFDQYIGSPVPEGKKSLAYSVAYRALDRTLTDDEVNQLHEQLLRDMSVSLPVEVRR